MATHGTDAHDRAQVKSLGPGETVDTGDQLSSVVLLGLAIVGGALSVLVNALL